MSLQSRHRGVAVDADEEDVAEASSRVEVTDVTDVKEIEAAVGEDEPLSLGAEPLGEPARFGNRHETVAPRAWRSSAGDTVAEPRFITTRPPAALEPRDGATTFIPIHGTDEIADVTGAGDTVISVFTLALAAGASPLEAATLANVAGGIVVMKRGSATVSPTELRQSLGAPAS